MLFALEQALDAVEVSRLPHRSRAECRKTSSITPVAEEYLNEAPPRRVARQYAFWHDTDAGFPLPLFSLDADVIQAFGLIWAELRQGI